jgi:hypothetical protein
LSGAKPEVGAGGGFARVEIRGGAAVVCDAANVAIGQIVIRIAAVEAATAIASRKARKGGRGARIVCDTFGWYPLTEEGKEFET